MKALNQAQRNALLVVTGSYRTTSTDALQVLAGVLPADLQARCRVAKWQLSHGHDVTEQGFTSIKEVDDWGLDEWQRRWQSSSTGRHTFKLWPDVRKRMSSKFVTVDHYLAQFATGHGDFAEKLLFFRSIDSSLCSCGSAENLVHVFLECPSIQAPDSTGHWWLVRLTWTPHLGTGSKLQKEL